MEKAAFLNQTGNYYMRFIKSGKESNKSDAELISLFRSNGDHEIIAQLFDRYSHLVFAVSMKYLKNEEDSKDAVLHIFERLPKDLSRYDIQNFSSWLHTVTKNYCFRFLSKKKYNSADIERIADQSDEDESEFIQQYIPFLNDAIGSLKEEQRICIELFYIQNLSYQEVSDKTNYTLNEVKSYIQNGKRNLKILLLKKSNDYF
jgi:RNA polymerase sigma factor (sigma-70 family)